MAPKRLYLLPCSIGIRAGSSLLHVFQKCSLCGNMFGDRPVEFCKLKIAFKVVPQWERVGFEPGVQSGGNELVGLLGQCRCINTGLRKQQLDGVSALFCGGGRIRIESLQPDAEGADVGLQFF